MTSKLPRIAKTTESANLFFNSEEAIPFLAIRVYKTELIFQVPGGRPLHISAKSAKELGKAITDLADTVEEQNQYVVAAGLAITEKEKND